MTLREILADVPESKQNLVHIAVECTSDYKESTHERIEQKWVRHHSLRYFVRLHHAAKLAEMQTLTEDIPHVFPNVEKIEEEVKRLDAATPAVVKDMVIDLYSLSYGWAQDFEDAIRKLLRKDDAYQCCEVEHFAACISQVYLSAYTIGVGENKKEYPAEVIWQK